MILLANELHTLLAEGFEIAKRTLPRQQPRIRQHHKHRTTLWPRSVREDVSTLTNRVKALRQLAKLESQGSQSQTVEDETHGENTVAETCNYLRDILSDPPDLRTVLDTPLRNIEALILDPREQAVENPDDDDSRENAIRICFQAHRLATRRTIRHARRLRNLKYGQSLLKLFSKKPKTDLKAILKASKHAHKPAHKTRSQTRTPHPQTSPSSLTTSKVASHLTRMPSVQLSKTCSERPSPPTRM